MSLFDSKHCNKYINEEIEIDTDKEDKIENNMDKVIFLDVDGVLNGKNTRARCQGYKGIDSKKVKLLAKLINETGATIILSSSWKHYWDKNPEYCDKFGTYLNKKLQQENLIIADKTFDRKKWRRGEGIKNYIEEHDVKNFVILDDEAFDFYDCNLYENWIQTDYYAGGITEEQIDLAIRKLNGEDICLHHNNLVSTNTHNGLEL